MSFREYLHLHHHIQLPVVSLADLLKDHTDLAMEFRNDLPRPLPLFRHYLQNGYLPFSIVDAEDHYLEKLYSIIDTTLITDLAFVEDYSVAHKVKIRKLLGVLAESVPFEPNISSLARKLHLGRETVVAFLHHLEKARLLNLLQKNTRGVAALQKPDKIYLENTNLSYALKPHPDTGTIRETFFVNQLKNSGHDIHLAEKGDFLIDDAFTFEIGGKEKSQKQIAEVSQAFIASDDLEVGAGIKIPLWLFGFLY